MIELNKIYQGNALTVLKTFPDKFFYTCITSPPYYGLRSYGTEPQKLVEPMIKAGCPEEICSKCNKPVIKVYEGKGGGVGASMHDHKDDNKKGMRCTNKKAKGGNGYHRIENKMVCDCEAGFHPGIVLDPFIGSGTTGIVARKLNRDFIGIDLKYHDISDKRLDKELGLFR